MNALFTTHEHDGYTVVAFRTPNLMNSADLDRLGPALYRLVEVEGRRRIVLDWAEVQYIASQAVGIVMALQKKVSAHKDGKLLLCGVGPRVMELLKITRLDRVLAIRPTQKDAATALAAA